MQGLIVADVDIIKMMDTTLESGNSDIIPAGLKVDGSISARNSSVINKEDFENLQKQVNKIIRQISRSILKGDIDIKPYKYNKTTGCDYCEFKRACPFDEGLPGQECRRVEKMCAEQFWEKIEEFDNSF